MSQNNNSNNTVSTTVLLAEQEAQAIDWADEKLDLSAAFAKVRAVLSARNASANAMLNALGGVVVVDQTSGGAAATGSTGAAQPTAAANANSAGGNNTAANANNNQFGGAAGASDNNKIITDPLCHLPTGNTSFGIYLFQFICLYFYFCFNSHSLFVPSDFYLILRYFFLYHLVLSYFPFFAFLYCM